MKNVRISSKRPVFVAFLSIGLLALASCNNNNPEDPKDVAEDMNDERFDERRSEKDAQFLVEAAAINMEEIELGKLAEERGTLTDVKELGKMMVKEHTDALNELKDLAESKSVVLPASLTEDGQDAYNKLNEKGGKEFDKEYCDMMVRGHKKAIDKFEKASSNAEDPDIRNWASSMLPALRTHLDHSNACQEIARAQK